MKVVFTAKARADLARIGDWVAQANPRRAVTLVDEIEDHCRRIALMPAAYSLVPRRERSGIRRAVHGNYLIFYRIDPDHVMVLHILHGAMDYEPVVFPEE